MTWHPTLTELRTVLATLYPTVDDGRRVMVDAGLDPLRIAFDAKAITNWQHILAEALRCHSLDKVLDVGDIWPNPGMRVDPSSIWPTCVPLSATAAGRVCIDQASCVGACRIPRPESTRGQDQKQGRIIPE